MPVILLFFLSAKRHSSRRLVANALRVGKTNEHVIIIRISIRVRTVLRPRRVNSGNPETFTCIIQIRFQKKKKKRFGEQFCFIVFMVIVAILLVNMLIAMMGNTYQKIAETRNEWQRQVSAYLYYSVKYK